MCFFFFYFLVLVENIMIYDRLSVFGSRESVTTSSPWRRRYIYQSEQASEREEKCLSELTRRTAFAYLTFFSYSFVLILVALIEKEDVAVEFKESTSSFSLFSAFLLSVTFTKRTEPSRAWNLWLIVSLMAEQVQNWVAGYKIWEKDIKCSWKFNDDNKKKRLSPLTNRIIY